MASTFDTDRLVFLQAQSNPISSGEYRQPPFRSGAFEESRYLSSTERAENARQNVQRTSVVDRIADEKFEKKNTLSQQNMMDTLSKDERVCVNNFFEGTSIKQKCDSIISDSIPNPLRRRLLTNFTMDAKLRYFKH
jgi:hypothetical protein